MVRELTENDVEFELECLPEDVAIEGNVLASGNDDEDSKAEQWVKDQLDSGNEWAWCTAKVTARWEGFEGTDYLGCCSYRSQDEFTQPGGYYDDMKAAALDELNKAISSAAAKLAKL